MKTNFNSLKIFLLIGLLVNIFSLVRAQSSGSCNASFSACKLPVVSITGLSIQFTNSSTGGYTNSLWSFGDGDTSTQVNPAHIYLSNKPFYVACLTVFNATAGCNNMVCDTVYATIASCSTTCIDSSLINHSIACPDVVAPVCGCNGVTYTNACVAEYIYGVSSWTNGACHTQYTCQADYTYTYTLTPNSASAMVQFSNMSTSSDSIISYDWSFGDGTSATGANPSHLYPVPGTYVACLTIATSGGCSSSKCDTLVFPGTVPCDIGGFSAAWTYSQTGPLTIGFRKLLTPSTITVAYEWNFGDDSISNAADPVHTYSSAGTYTVCLVAYIPGTTCSDTLCKQITVTGTDTTCQASFTYKTLLTATVGNEVQFDNTSTGNYDHWLWTFGDGDSSSLPDPLHDYLFFKVYYIACLTISDSSEGCSSTTCDTVLLEKHSSCIDTSLIDHSQPCPLVYLPVCGCNGVTYINSCVAEHYFGVSSWTEGRCHIVFPMVFPPTPFSPFFPGHAAGGYGLILPPVTGGDAEKSATGVIDEEYGNFALGIFPNPAGDKVTVVYILPEQSELAIDVIDLVGNTVAHLFTGTQSAGEQQINLETGSMANGIYIVRIIANGTIYSQKLSVIH